MMHMNCLQIMWWRLLLPWVRRESPLFLMSWSIQQQQITWESCTRFRRDSAIAVLGCRLVISLLIIYLDKNITIPSPKKDRVHGEDRIWQCLRFFLNSFKPGQTVGETYIKNINANTRKQLYNVQYWCKLFYYVTSKIID